MPLRNQRWRISRRLVVKYFSRENVRTTFRAIHEAESTQLIYEFLPFAEAQKDGRKPVLKPHDALMRFSAASYIAISQLISFKCTRQ